MSDISIPEVRRMLADMRREMNERLAIIEAALYRRSPVRKAPVTSKPMTPKLRDGIRATAPQTLNGACKTLPPHGVSILAECPKCWPGSVGSRRLPITDDTQAPLPIMERGK